MNEQGRYVRILSLYSRFIKGEVINKYSEAQRFGVDVRTIQRDIEDIRNYLATSTDHGLGEVAIKYYRSLKGFKMVEL